MFHITRLPAGLAVVGAGLSLMTVTGCQSLLGHNDETVVTTRREFVQPTVVKVYSLEGIGLKDAPVEEIEAFTKTIRDMVVTKQWERSNSAIQVFGILMTVRTTPQNHLLIEHYLDQVHQIVAPTRLSLRAGHPGNPGGHPGAANPSIQ